jgi:SAM-dependent MidA family methyltransferase
VRQSKFLTEILAQARSEPDAFAPWDERRTRQFQTLTHPEHLGHKFRVLVQTRQ